MLELLFAEGEYGRWCLVLGHRYWGMPEPSVVGDASQFVATGVHGTEVKMVVVPATTFVVTRSKSKSDCGPASLPAYGVSIYSTVPDAGRRISDMPAQTGATFVAQQLGVSPLTSAIFG